MPTPLSSPQVYRMFTPLSNASAHAATGATASAAGPAHHRSRLSNRSVPSCGPCAGPAATLVSRISCCCPGYLAAMTTCPPPHRHLHACARPSAPVPCASMSRQLPHRALQRPTSRGFRVSWVCWCCLWIAGLLPGQRIGLPWVHVPQRQCTADAQQQGSMQRTLQPAATRTHPAGMTAHQGLHTAAQQPAAALPCHAPCSHTCSLCSCCTALHSIAQVPLQALVHSASCIPPSALPAPHPHSSPASDGSSSASSISSSLPGCPDAMRTRPGFWLRPRPRTRAVWTDESVGGRNGSWLASSDLGGGCR